MASSKRERELARMRVERQAARRAAVAARRRQRNATLGAVAGVLAVVLIAVGVFLATRSKTKAPVDALKNPLATPTPSATPAPKIIPGNCTYPTSGTAAKPVKLPPPTTKVEIAKPFTASLVTNRGDCRVLPNSVDRLRQWRHPLRLSLVGYSRTVGRRRCR